MPQRFVNGRDDVTGRRPARPFKGRDILGKKHPRGAEVGEGK